MYPGFSTAEKVMRRKPAHHSGRIGHQRQHNS